MGQSEIIGKRLQKYREILALSLADLAERTQLPVSLLEDFEGGRVSPSIGVMIKLARALGQRVGTFMDDQPVKDPVLTRAIDREQGMASHKESQGHYRYFSLGSGKSDRHMEPFFIDISVSEDKTMSSHEGEEFVVVISGELELLYGQERHLLKPGDSIYYNSIVPHCLNAVGGDAKIYAVIYTL
jgi:transcriptional regulator with XRE-family HTH domain